MGIFNFVHRHAVSNYQTELRNLLDSYSRLDKRQIADYFIFSVWTRAGLQNEGYFKLPDGKSSVSPDVSYFMLAPLQAAAKTFEKRGNRIEAQALSIWVQTMRGIVNTEMEADLKNLWQLIMRTNNYWEEYLDKIYQEDKISGMDIQLLKNTLSLSKEILAKVPPEQFR